MFISYALNLLYESDLLWVTTSLFTLHESHLSERQFCLFWQKVIYRGFT